MLDWTSIGFPKGLTRVFGDAGLDKYWFPVSKMPKKGEEDWPTVNDMVEKNYRLHWWLRNYRLHWWFSLLILPRRRLKELLTSGDTWWKMIECLISVILCA
nr:PI-PLC X domain-containing protein At5g67130 [Ipomoea trifida]GMC57729.1 PI-PLC X domain-containing protein At5g67130 [Ipomoea batatas]GMC62800.1 PI-PLC X domain-containing protein At5g67130 [Ipomoea batatas]GME19270.1 PI-PLC X domain-containing protein At5g67130 [Ipomoea batatas]